MPGDNPKSRKKRSIDAALIIDIIDKLDHLHKCVHTTDQKISNQISELDKKVDLQGQKLEYELKAIRELDESQNKILDEHQQRSVELKRDNDMRETVLKAEIEKLNERIVSLEEPRKFLKTFREIIIWAGKIGAAAAACWAGYEILLKVLK